MCLAVVPACVTAHTILVNNNLCSYLNVGCTAIYCHRFRSTLATLLAVQGSFFWNIINSGGDPDAVLPRTPNGDFFIDRNGAVFSYVLEYLRACVNGEMTFPLPDNIR